MTMPSQSGPSRYGRLAVVLLLAASLLGLVRPVWACPFCSSISITFGEEMKGATAAVVAKLVELPQQPAAGADNNALASDSLARFEIVTVLKGKELLGDARDIKVTYFGQDEIGKPFLIMGSDTPQVVWNTPVPLTERAVAYVEKLPSLPEAGADRLAYFQDYLEDSEEMLARDAYDEFAKAPYPEVKGLKDRMHHDQLVAWIKKSEVPPSRRRLYLTMLGVCGSRDDVPMLEEIIKSDDRDLKTALDAVVACYLTLNGADGLPLVEDRFLKNPDAEYTDTYAAIMALRFHGQEEQIIPKERLVQSLEYMLDRPQLADLVIPDLARWEDWKAMNRLVTLFKEANDETSWVRVPVINFLNACPLPEAKTQLAELEKIDPDAVKRATSAFPFAGAVAKVPPPSGDAAAAPADQPATSEQPETSAQASATEETAVPKLPAPDAPVAENTTAAADVDSASAPVAADEPTGDSVAAAKSKSETAKSETASEADQDDDRDVAQVSGAVDRNEPLVEQPRFANTPVWLVVVIPVAAGLLLLGVFLVVLRGERGRTNV